MKKIITCPAVFFLALICNQGMAQPIPPQVLVDRVIANRASIKSGHFRYRTETTEYIHSALSGKRESEIWFDATRLRCDRVTRLASSSTTRREVECKNYDTQKALLRYMDADKILNAEFTSKQENIQNKYYWLGDPRLLGFSFIPSNAIATGMSLKEYSFFSVRFQQKDEVVQETNRGTIVYRFLRGDNRNCLFEIDRNKDWSVIRAETRSAPGDSEQTETTVEVEIKQYGDVWFPSSFYLRENKHGKPYRYEVTIVDFAEFNTPLAGETFTYPGIGIKPGTTIRDLDARKEWVYTGDERGLVDPSAYFKSIVPEPRPLQPVPGSGPNYGLIGAAVGLGAIGIFFLYRSYKRRLAQP
jgi:hypothetical protein